MVALDKTLSVLSDIAHRRPHIETCAGSLLPLATSFKQILPRAEAQLHSHIELVPHTAGIRHALPPSRRFPRRMTEYILPARVYAAMDTRVGSTSSVQSGR